MTHKKDRGAEGWGNWTVDDPLSELQDGARLTFEAVTCKFTEKQFAEIKLDWSKMNGVMLCVGFGNLAGTEILGSAVMVAPGVAVCAWHVFSDRLDKFSLATEWAVCYTPFQEHLQMWRVLTYTPVAGTDLVLLGLQLATPIHSSKHFHQAVISARVPAIGEEVTFIGASAKKEFFATDGTREGENAVLEVFLSRGAVTARYLPTRDSVLLPWPCIEVDCATHGGMSGGPVFDANGALIGVLCSSFETQGESKPSYASLLYPALIARYKGGWPEQFFPGPQVLLKNQHCIIDRREAFVGEVDPNADRVDVQFRYD